jgi:CHAD domain-containing protein
MPYRLDLAADPADALRAAVREQLDDAVRRLRDDRSGDPAEAVHEARKDLKKARSAIRLARGGIGRKRCRKANRGLRDAGRALSGTRDADVRSETLRRLRDAFSDELSTATATAIDAAIEEAERAAGAGAGGADPSEVAARAAAEIERVRAAVARWELSTDGWKLVGPGLERGYRRGRLEFRRVLDGPTPEAIHSWRKRAKDLWYHLRLVRGGWPAVLEATIAEVHELTDLLGDHHDLTALRDHLRSRSIGPADADRDAEILELIERRQEQLAEQAIPLGERLYAEKPSAFAARVAGYWRAWRVD